MSDIPNYPNGFTKLASFENRNVLDGRGGVLAEVKKYPYFNFKTLKPDENYTNAWGDFLNGEFTSNSITQGVCSYRSGDSNWPIIENAQYGIWDSGDHAIFSGYVSNRRGTCRFLFFPDNTATIEETYYGD